MNNSNMINFGYFPFISAGFLRGKKKKEKGMFECLWKRPAEKPRYSRAQCKSWNYSSLICTVCAGL